MNVTVITSHPWDGSFNHAVFDSLLKGLMSERAGHQVDLIDLNKDGFNPVMSENDLKLYSKGQSGDPKVAEFQERLDKTDHLVIIYPVWWGIMPAILKGFIDKVFTHGWAYDTLPNGLLKGRLKIKSATVITTMDTPKLFFSLLYKSAFERIFTKGVLRTCGIKKVKSIPLTSVSGVKDSVRKKWLADIEKYGANLKS